ncbi:Fc receptor-like protein 5 [Odontesthes bonariensis]|uniref:Fc receptor-like protein 5 n=1 Tax=Odontesthes bonariensis TaxID=219752 RepID=UPI003F583ECF
MNPAISIKATVILQPSWAQIYSGETVSLTCWIQGADYRGWEYEWRPTNTNAPTSSEYRIIAESNSREYSCRGKRGYLLTEWSKGFTLKVSPSKPRATLTAERRTIPAGGSVTLTCSVDRSDGWRFDWFRGGSAYSAAQPGTNNEVITVSQGGLYHCRGGRGGGGEPGFYSEVSRKVTIEETLSIKATVILQPSWAQIYSGETVTARCEIQGGGGTQWMYEWRRTGLNIPPTSSEYRISRVTDSGGYSCRGRKDKFNSTQWSDVITVTVSESKPRATLTAEITTIPAGGSVTLTCSVDRSDGWRFDWFRGGSAYSAAQPGTNNEVITVSQGGLYHCRGGRGGGGGEPGFYSEVSSDVTIEETLSIKATVILQPSWAQIYSGETVTARCEIQGGGGTQWMYEWRPARLNRPPTSSEYRISRVTDSGGYRCRGRRDQLFLTQWSDVITVTVSDKPRPVLTVSPSWLSPGASVTLSCQVEHPSAGWRFYWYKAVPDPSERSYSYELLPDSNNGTEHGSYIIHGQTHTAGYVCRAGRGDPVYYTDYSHPEIVWSADLHPAASLTVSPDRVQHFRGDPVSLNCEGKSAEWRVRRITEAGDLSHCSESVWGTMTGSSCNIESLWSGNAVFWCESGSGEFSNAVNMTGQKTNSGVILVSPVHPVTEGGSVSLSCRRRGQNTLSNVFFYHNDTLLQSDSRGELNISAVSQSDEGFYKCEHSGEVSSQSWISVKAVSRPEGSLFPVLMVVGPIIGLIFIVLLLLLCRCRRSKGSVTEQTVNQDETQQQVYSSLLHGDLCVYETVRGGEASADGEQEGDYANVPSVISPTIRAGGENMMIRRIEEDGSDYYNVNPDSTAAMKPQ